jgi:DNA adenine methylase
MFPSLCRYVGGKAKLAPRIAERITQNQIGEYREPFAGAASVGLNLLVNNAIPSAWLNDCDPGIFCMWTAAVMHPAALKEAVRAITPSVAEFDRIKAQFLNRIAVPTSAAAIVALGADKIALQQLSYGGLGQMAHGPLGGRAQLSGGIDSRWNPSAICAKIDRLAPYLRRARITHCDFGELLLDGTRAGIYLDPPYYSVGDKLYQYSLSHSDHVRLSECLRQSDHNWLLSYNDCPEVRVLYNFAHIERISTTYSTVKRSTFELLISPPNRNRTFVFYPMALAA